MNSLVVGYEDSDEEDEAQGRDERAMVVRSDIEDEEGQADELRHANGLDVSPIRLDLDLCATQGIPEEAEGEPDPQVLANFLSFTSAEHPGSFFDRLRANRLFGNPAMLRAVVMGLDLREHGSNFPRNVWDPRWQHARRRATGTWHICNGKPPAPPHPPPRLAGDSNQCTITIVH